MPAFIALLRAVNVGGTGKLAMTDLVKLCAKAGFARVETYIQSGNVVFESSGTESDIKTALETALAKKLKTPVGVMVRRAADLDSILAKNPFPEAPKNRVIVFFFDEAPPKKAIAEIEAPTGEQLALDGRHLYVCYPNGQGNSKLKVPFANIGTGRNLNTIAKLTTMANALASRTG